MDVRRSRDGSDVSGLARAPSERQTERQAGTRATRPRRTASGERRATRTPTISPEEMLSRAMRAETPRTRATWARRGLAARQALDRTTQSMLLRQLYLSFYESRRFPEALAIAEQNAELGVLRDVVHQDAARACTAMGDVDGAAGHLRLAARTAPAARKAFHWWTLGSVYFLAGRHADAAAALARAARWGTSDRPLYQGHLAVVQCAQGKRVRDLGTLIDRLAEVPAGQGYGRFVLGQMAFYGGRPEEAKRYLNAFVRRTESGRAAMAIALDGEIAEARRLLDELD